MSSVTPHLLPKVNLEQPVPGITGHKKESSAYYPARKKYEFSLISLFEVLIFGPPSVKPKITSMSIRQKNPDIQELKKMIQNNPLNPAGPRYLRLIAEQEKEEKEAKEFAGFQIKYAQLSLKSKARQLAKYIKNIFVIK